MTRRFEENRPTPVTVIGWAWIVLGSMMLVSGCLSLLMSVLNPISSSAEDLAEAPFGGLWRHIWLFATVQIAVSITGVVAGKRFLALKARARTTLELLSWVLLAALLGFAVLWVTNALGIASAGEATQPVAGGIGHQIEGVEPGGPGGPGGLDDGAGFATIFAGMGVLMTLMYGAPLGLMIYHLRSTKVRSALSE